MKNSKFLKPAIALSLVGAMAVGGTLAYITSGTVEVNNEFTFAYSSGEGEYDESSILKISLEETFYEADGKTEVATDVDGVYSTTFLPGDEFSKTATVTLPTNELEDGAYVFLYVEGDTDDNVTYSVDSKWVLVSGYDDLYVLKDKTDGVVTGEETTGWTVLTDNKVSIATDALGSELNNVEIDINIAAYAIQAANLSQADAAIEAYAAFTA